MLGEKVPGGKGVENKHLKVIKPPVIKEREKKKVIRKKIKPILELCLEKTKH